MDTIFIIHGEGDRTKTITPRQNFYTPPSILVDIEDGIIFVYQRISPDTVHDKIEFKLVPESMIYRGEVE